MTMVESMMTDTEFQAMSADRQAKFLRIAKRHDAKSANDKALRIHLENVHDSLHGLTRYR